jgi:hypothetical protein
LPANRLGSVRKSHQTFRNQWLILLVRVVRIPRADREQFRCMANRHAG